MTEEREFELKAKIETYKGGITISIFDLLNQLSDEEKQEILSDGGWWNFISDEMAETIVNEFSRKSYSPIYHKLRTQIINSESMPTLLREWADFEYNARIKAEEAEGYWSRAYWELHHWVNDYSSRKTNGEPQPKLPDRCYGKEYSKELIEKVFEKCQEFGAMFPPQEREGE